MKKKFVIVNSLLSVAILFSILLQFAHTYEHISKQLYEKNCQHKYTSSQEITHQHDNLDHCYVCHFSISSFVASDIHYFDLQNTNFFVGSSFLKSNEITQFFKGSLFALRAPPLS